MRAPLVFVDCEMTGLRASSDRIIEVCAERVSGSVTLDRLETLVLPDTDVSGNAHIHGIDPAALAGAPTFASFADRLQALIEGAVLVAHGAEWDVAFIEAEFSRLGRSISIPFFLDTLTLSRRAFVLPSHSLEALCRELGIDRGRAHRAGDDVAALRALWSHVVRALAPTTPRDLWHVRIGERHARPEVLRAAEDAVERGAPVIVRYRPARRTPQDLHMCITALRTDVEPPRLLGYLLPGRGRRELRADRVLSIEAPHDPKHSSGRTSSD